MDELRERVAVKILEVAKKAPSSQPVQAAR